MRISSSDKNAYALAKALATIKHTGIACMINRRGEHSLIPTTRMHPDDKRQIVKIITPKLWE
jgi:hypothetical protein